MKILDCTLRDGGYYNDWDFDNQKARELIVALNEAGVDIIEVGYKSADTKGFGGLFKYCNESLLAYLRQYTDAEYAFMIDVKEFLLPDQQLNLRALDAVVRPAADSVFSWVRLASHYATLETIPAFITYFQQKGYQICFNLMGGSLLSDEQIRHALHVIRDNPPEVFYVADSFGSFYPEDIKRLIGLIKANFGGQVGIHTHDNQGMAFSNTLAAIEAGVDFVDGTVTGMGRGAGNLVLEQFLQKYADQSGNPKYRPNALLGIINQYIQPLKQQYQWGFNYVYMLSGLKNIHPTYCQKLSEGNRYSIGQISAILERIPAGKRAKYDVQVLEHALREVLEGDTSAGREAVELPLFQPSPSPVVLILAKGSSVQQHTEALAAFAQARQALIIDCNHTGALSALPNQRLTVILNEVRLHHYLESFPHATLPVVTGQRALIGQQAPAHLYFAPFSLGDFSVTTDPMHIPDYDAGLYALGLAFQHGAGEIYLAGFDGFGDEQANQQMDAYFAQVAHAAAQQGIALEIITPTRYAQLPTSSVYAHLP